MSAATATATASSSLPSHLASQVRNVNIQPFAAVHTSSITSPDAFAALNIDNTLTLESFASTLSIDIIALDHDNIVFDLIGIDAAIANALRRILLAEVPSIAIEKVIIFQNTSIIADEVLAHRLGLIPIEVNPTSFTYLEDDESIPNELNTLVFTLDVHCNRVAGVSETAINEEKYEHSLITSKDLVWHPQGSQLHRFPAPVKPTYDDITIAKLRPGQSIVCELHAEKGIGARHAKWSPVATASYRLLPEIHIVQPVLNELAIELKHKCPMNVFDIEELTDNHYNALPSPPVQRAVVARPRNCTMCRECIRGPGWSDRVSLNRVKNHFIFSVETTGAYTPAQVVKEAIHILKQKAQTIIHEIKQLQQEEETEEETEDK